MYLRQVEIQTFGHDPVFYATGCSLPGNPEVFAFLLVLTWAAYPMASGQGSLQAGPRITGITYA
jgi:hypothetical protein